MGDPDPLELGQEKLGHSRIATSHFPLEAGQDADVPPGEARSIPSRHGDRPAASWLHVSAVMSQSTLESPAGSLATRRSASRVPSQARLSPDSLGFGGASRG
jgi:hypothetical protein